ncbi:class I SAM-dependent methyltransferase [uncultured Kordia sp.]|uniref:O-methyltransferase n=1 Tax=uncultured Kordia sp. TaxID=507699 RepID=UPI002605A979|nr:class I SAM-dependent methyltransferase [uncultured Kordia sp.]
MQIVTTKKQIEMVINELFKDSKNDYIKMAKGIAKGIFRPLQPADFKEAYLSISKEQGENLIELIQESNSKNIVEFGTSFGISTLYLAQAAMETSGYIVTTELIESKAKKAIQNFTKAGVNELIEMRIGNALETLNNYSKAIDFLLLDGWKDLYLPLFQMLESNFQKDTIIYVDNADMSDVQAFLRTISENSKYQLESKYHGKVMLITLK